MGLPWRFDVISFVLCPVCRGSKAHIKRFDDSPYPPLAAWSKMAVKKDEEVLAGLGYKQEFKRAFTLFEVFGIGFSIIGLLPSIAYVDDVEFAVFSL